MTDKIKEIYNAVPGSSRVLCGGDDDVLRVLDKSNGESNNGTEHVMEYSEVCSGKENKNIIKKEYIESRLERKSDDWENSKVREIEDTLGTLGSLIDEYQANNNKVPDKEAEYGQNVMEIEQERAVKRKKECSPVYGKENTIKTDSEDDVRLPKRSIAKSKIDTSLPIYDIVDSSSEKEDSPGVECTGMEMASSTAKKAKPIRTPRRKMSGSSDISIKEISQTSDYGKYEDMTAPRMGSIAIEWLNDIEIIRKKCGNIPGKLSGHIKENGIR